MKTPFKTLVLFLCLLSPAYSWAEETNYSFDTVTEINLNYLKPSISGIEKDTGNPLTVTFKDKGTIHTKYRVNRCVPVFLTAMEKPGRYYLHLTISSDYYTGLASCRLEVKS